VIDEFVRGVGRWGGGVGGVMADLLYLRMVGDLGGGG